MISMRPFKTKYTTNKPIVFDGDNPMKPLNVAIEMTNEMVNIMAAEILID